MPQVAVRCPLGEFDLSDQLGMKPAAVFHFLFTQCPLRALFLRQIREGTDIRLQFSKPFETSRRTPGTKPSLTLAAYISLAPS
jgi:hypothetical protein